MCVALNPNISVKEKNIAHRKASEAYVHVEFTYEDRVWDGWVPTEYRRTGISLKDENELNAYLNAIYEEMRTERLEAWKAEQEKFWAEEKPKAATTKEFFDALSEGGWKCVDCDLPHNPNWARRVQDLKEFGYTIATDTNRFCQKCGKNKTHLLLLPIRRGASQGNGYETWSPALRKRIVAVLNGIDVYENTKNPNCLPDHKFSEIRWDEFTKASDLEQMTDAQIKAKFQLLTNQRNLQKREVCRTCYQTGKRGVIFGIPFFYEGSEKWDDAIPKTGKEAEKGCIGCPWYDIDRWRKELIKVLNK